MEVGEHEMRWEVNGKTSVDEPIRPCRSTPELLGILGGHVRFELMTVLARAERHVGALVNELDLCVPHISTNLRVLRVHGLVEATQIKKNRFYRITDLVQLAGDDQNLVMRIKAQDGGTVEITVKRTK